MHQLAALVLLGGLISHVKIDIHYPRVLLLVAIAVFIVSTLLEIVWIVRYNWMAGDYLGTTAQFQSRTTKAHLCRREHDHKLIEIDLRTSRLKADPGQYIFPIGRSWIRLWGIKCPGHPVVRSRNEYKSRFIVLCNDPCYESLSRRGHRTIPEPGNRTPLPLMVAGPFGDRIDVNSYKHFRLFALDWGLLSLSLLLEEIHTRGGGVDLHWEFSQGRWSQPLPK